MITGKINLMNLTAFRKQFNAGIGPVDCIVIPIEKNKLFVGEKGIYLNLIGFDFTPKNDSKDTHLVKQQLSKEEREKMTEEQLKAMPILGTFQAKNGHQEADPVSSMTVLPEGGDLPF